MSKLSFKPTLPKFVKHWSLKVLLGVLVLALLVAYGAVRSVQLNRAQEHDREVAAAQLKVKEDAYQSTISSLEGQNARLQANVKASCQYLTALTSQKATKSLVIIPTASGCPFPKQ